MSRQTGAMLEVLWYSQEKKCNVLIGSFEEEKSVFFLDIVLVTSSFVEEIVPKNEFVIWIRIIRIRVELYFIYFQSFTMTKDHVVKTSPLVVKPPESHFKVRQTSAIRDVPTQNHPTPSL